MDRRRRIARFLAASGGGSPPAAERWYWDLNGLDERLANTTPQAFGIEDQWSLLFNLRVDDPSSSGQQILCQILQSGGAQNAIVVRKPAGSTLIEVLVNSASGSSIKNLAYDVLGSAGDPLHLIITYDGSDTGDPLVVYSDGSPVSPEGGGTDNTGTMTAVSRRISIGFNLLSPGQHFDGGVQDVAVDSSVWTPGDASTLSSQKNDSDPIGGFSPLHHWTPQDGASESAMGTNYGTESLNIMDNALGVTVADNRIQGNLFP